ncbi:MAG: VWA domain-containing protein [Planctomycetota bacterium]
MTPHSHWSLDPLFGSAWLGWILVVGLFVTMLVTMPRELSAPRRRTLTALRLIAIAVMVLVLWRPGLVQSNPEQSTASLVIGIDTSKSMTLASGDSGSRWSQQTDFLERLVSRFNEAEPSLRIDWIAYDESSVTLSNQRGNVDSLMSPVDQVAPIGARTNLTKPLQLAIETASSNPLIGMVLIGDGTQTVTEFDQASAAISDPRRVAQTMGAMGVPLWTIPVGPPTEASTTRDIAIESLPESYRLFAGNEIAVAFEANIKGFAGEPIQITATWIPETDDAKDTSEVERPTKAAQRTVEASSPSEKIAVSIPLLAPKPGRYRLAIAAENADRETITSNNQQVAFVDVRDGGGRVLYIEGAIRLEQQYLRRALRGFPDLDITFRWIPSDTRSRWPIQLDVPLQRSRYDVVIIGDLEAAAIGNDQWTQLANGVDDGMALITLGGQHAYGPGGYSATKLSQVLPVVMNQGDDAQSRSSIRLRPDRSHPITSVRVGGDLVDWTTLPAMPGANQWRAAKTAAGTQTLLSDENRRAMMVVGQYGGGRVASLAFDSTWMWWRSGASDFHRRFWRQLILWSLSREEDSADQMTLELDSRRFASAQSTQFRAELTSTAQMPPQLRANVVLDSGEVRSIDGRLSQRRNGNETQLRLNGSLGDLPPGFHRLRVEAADGGSTEPATVSFEVIDDTRELTEARTDHALLRQLSAYSANVGGRSYRVDEVDQIVEQVLNRRRNSQSLTLKKVRLGDDSGTAWLMFAVFLGCLSTTWWLRRRWGLA